MIPPISRVEHFLNALGDGEIPNYPEDTLTRKEHFLKAACENYKYLVEHKLDATFIKDTSPTTADKGQIGQFWYNKVTGEMYILTDIDMTDPSNPYYMWDLISAGGGSSGIFVGFVTNGGSFPTTRLDGSALQEEDYVRPVATSTFPFTISGVTFNSARDKAVYTGAISPHWVIDPGLIQNTAETPTYDPTTESISGVASTQKVVNQENKIQIERKVDKDLTHGDLVYSVVNGNPNNQPLNKSAVQNTIAWRGDSGTLKVGTPIAGGDATTKNYVDSHDVSDSYSEFKKDLTGSTDKLNITLKDYNGTELVNKSVDFEDKLVLADKTQTIKNKTIDADDNTITDLKTANINSDTLIDSTEVLSTTLDDAQLVTAKAAKTLVDNVDLSVEKQSTPESGYAVTYVLKKGSVEITPKINIPLDYLVKSGKITTVTNYATNTAYTAGDVINHSGDTSVVNVSITAADNTGFSALDTTLVTTAATGAHELVLAIGTKTGTASPEYVVIAVDSLDYTAGSAINIDPATRSIAAKVDNSTITIDSSDQLSVKDHGLNKVKTTDEFWTDNVMTGTTNAENIVVSGDGTIDTLTVQTTSDFPEPTSDANAATKKYVDTAIGKTFRFKGYVSTSAPTGAKENELWYEDSAMPTTFPVQVKTYNGTSWSSTTTPYTPDTMDLWANKNDDHGYYWFGNAWNKIDFNANVDEVTIDYNGANKLEVKDEGISLSKFAKHTSAADMVYTIEADGTTGLEKCRQYERVDSFASVVGDTRTAYYLDTPYIVGTDVYEVGVYIWDPVTHFTLIANTGSGGTTTPIFVGEVSNGDVFPGARPDGSALIIGDYVRPYAGSTFPFTIDTVTFTNARDTAVFMGSGHWLLNASVYQKTNETPVNNKTNESIDGSTSTAVYQADINAENKTAINAAAKSGVFERTSDDKLHLNIKDRNNNNIIEEKRSDVVFRTVTEDNGAISTIDNQKGQHGSVLQSEFGDTIVSVNTADENGEDGIVAQVYAKTKSTNQGARLNVKKTGMYYGKGTSATTDPSEELATLGDVSLPDDITVEKNASGKLQVKDSGITKAKIDPAADVVFKDDAQTLTAKTIDADDNTITDLTGSNLKAQTASDAKKTWVVQHDGSWALGKAGSDVDDTTIEEVSNKLQVKDGGLTVAKMNSEAVSKDIPTSGGSDDKLTTEKAVLKYTYPKNELDEKLSERVTQFLIMPTASAEYYPKLVQYIGVDTTDYIHGYFYQCSFDGTSYTWENVQVQEGSTGGGVIPVPAKPTTDIDETAIYRVDDEYYNYDMSQSKWLSFAQTNETATGFTKNAKMVKMTKDEYAALTTKDNDTVYFVDDGSTPTCPFPVGETKVQYTENDNPNDLYPGTVWNDITSTVDGKYAKFDTVNTVGTYAPESLPTPAITLNTKGSHGHAIFSAGGHTHGIRGWKNVCKDSNDVKVVSLDYISGDSPRYTDSAGSHTHTTSADGDHTHTATVDTSGVYKSGAKVQPASFTIKLWQRIS